MNLRISSFFITSYVWSWSFWGLAALTALDVRSGAGEWLFYLGLLGPAVAGIRYVYSSRDGAIISDYWLRVRDFKRIGLPSFVLICLLFPAVTAIAAFLPFLLSGLDPSMAIADRLLRLFSDPAVSVGTLVTVLIRGPLPEELGWRGAILDDLQRTLGFMRAAFVLGITWATWHLPLFLMPGTLHHDYGLVSDWCWQFFAQVVCMSVVFSWIYNRTRRSTLAIILAHFMANLAMMIGNVSAGINAYALAAWIVVAVAIVFGGRQVAPPPAQREA